MPCGRTPAQRLLVWLIAEAGIEVPGLGRAELGKAAADGVPGLPIAGRRVVRAATAGILDPLGADRRAEVVATEGGGAARSVPESRLVRLLG